MPYKVGKKLKTKGARLRPMLRVKLRRARQGYVESYCACTDTGEC